MDYGKTLNLPETEFPMRAGLPQREPDFLKFWEENDIYGKKQALHAGHKKFVLHDGPPYGRIVTVIVPYTSMIFNTQHKAASFLAVSA